MGALMLVLLALAPAPDQAARLPPHDFAIVGTEKEIADPRLLVPRLAEALARALGREGLGSPGYPRACRVVFTPVPDRPAASTVSCLDRELRPPERPAPGEKAGLRLDPDGRFLDFSVVRTTDTRVYLMEVFVVRGRPDPVLRTAGRWEVPRLAVLFPDVPAPRLPGLLRALDSALRELGAQPLERPVLD